jgi:hypothetical protein
MKVRIIGKANGVGLSRDINLLATALRSCGCEVRELACGRRERKRRRSAWTRLLARVSRDRPSATRAEWDVNIMLEHVWPQFLQQAPLNVLVPNPEWFDRRDATFIHRFDRIWAKTAVADQIFTERGCPTMRIGFDSEDRLAAEVVRQPRFLHLAGRSELKGTARLLREWQQHPEWPTLTVIQDAAAVTTPHQVNAANITLETRFLDDAQLRELQNSHRFHLCLSEAEGWGHYIAEALSVGAVTITCDAAPMNELVTVDRGILLHARDGGAHNLSRVALFKSSALQTAVARIQNFQADELIAMSLSARRWFVENKREFPARIQRAVTDLEQELQRVRT